MKLHRILLISLTTIWFTLFVGCQSQWEINVENKSEGECSVYVSLAYSEADKDGQSSGTSSAKLENMAKGHSGTLIVGNHPRIITEIRLVQGEEETILTPDHELTPGRNYNIWINAEGKLEVDPAK